MADLVGPAEQQMRLEEIELVLRVGVATRRLALGEADEVPAHGQRPLARQRPMGEEKPVLAVAANGLGRQRSRHFFPFPWRLRNP